MNIITHFKYLKANNRGDKTHVGLKLFLPSRSSPAIRALHLLKVSAC